VQTQTAQIYTQKFSSLQLDLRTRDPEICDFVICNMNTQQPKSATAINRKAYVNYNVTSGFDVVSWILLKKLMDSDRMSFLWKTWQFFQRTTWGALMCGGLWASPEDLP